MVSFFVPGLPAPGGSKKVFLNRKTGKPIVTDAGGKANKDWRAVVALTAGERFHKPLSGPIKLHIIFYLPHPQAHYRTGKNNGVLKENAPLWHEKRPDGLKLRRSVEDALTGIAWIDDSQIAVGTEEKRYGERIGAEIRIEAM
ncbi:MAG: RusA family crossover junction endodeoxyribonuclease [Desulfobacterales bacterium]|nr:RusA family crossover junction endodeoxyribonuclease [Desulfobacterales bacterium]